jgi:large subunit ribosomal protein L20
MVRVTRGKSNLKRRKKCLKLAKGYVGSNSRLSVFAAEQIRQSFNYAYIGRRKKKRQFRRLWIVRINAASRSRENIYSRILGCLRSSNILLNRKMLAFFAYQDLSLFNLLERQSRKSDLYN